MECRPTSSPDLFDFLQEAMKNGNAHNYFNALRRLDFRNLVRSLSRWQLIHSSFSHDSFRRKDLEDFQRTHIIAATREVRPDIVRALFQYMKVPLDPWSE